MADTLDHNLPIFTVTEISAAVKRTIEDRFPLVRIRGEISAFKRAASGHVYLTLKDEGAVIDGVIWRGAAGKLALAPEVGMEVVTTGRITTYASGGMSKYQIVIDHVELAGEGALLKLLEDRRKKLAAEGLFDEDRKQDIPYLPAVVGVVTSPTGAVIRDILHRLSDRFPVRVILWPVAVQGENAAGEITAAIRGFNVLGKDADLPRPDVLIVGRGGGSVEDLMAFNEEAVVRAAAASDIPLISAVGHETDTTLIDHAADLRAPTPTAAAEHAVPVRADLIEEVAGLDGRLRRSMTRVLDGHDRTVQNVSRGLPNLRRMVEEATQRLDDWSGRLGRSLVVGVDRREGRLRQASARLRCPDQRIDAAAAKLAGEVRALGRAMETAMKTRASRLAQADRLLRGLSYERALERGFALVTGPDGGRIGRAAEVHAGEALNVRFYDDVVGVRVEGGGARPQTKRKKKTASDDDGGQGSLL